MTYRDNKNAFSSHNGTKRHNNFSWFHPHSAFLQERARAACNGAGPYTLLTLCRLARGIAVAGGWRTFSRWCASLSPSWQTGHGSRCCRVFFFDESLQFFATSFDAIGDALDEGGQRHGAEIFVAAQAHGNGVGGSLFIADDQHVRNLLQLRVAHFGVHAFAARIPAALSASSTWLAYSIWRSAMGIIIACTGASQTGKAPA